MINLQPSKCEAENYLEHYSRLPEIELAAKCVPTQAVNEHQIESAESPNTRVPNFLLLPNILKKIGFLNVRERGPKRTSEVRGPLRLRNGILPEIRLT